MTFISGCSFNLVYEFNLETFELFAVYICVFFLIIYAPIVGSLKILIYKGLIKSITYEDNEIYLINPYGKQNYQCKNCKRQFIGDHALSYRGCHSGITNKILHLMVRGGGVRDIAETERISIDKVLRTLSKSA